MWVRSLVVSAFALFVSVGEAASPNRGSLYEKFATDELILAVTSVQKALETHSDGKTLRWNHTDTGSEGAITPTRTYLIAGGLFCRDYREKIRSGHETEVVYHIACRSEDAGWISADDLSAPFFDQISR